MKEYGYLFLEKLIQNVDIDWVSSSPYAIYIISAYGFCFSVLLGLVIYSNSQYKKILMKEDKNKERKTNKEIIT